MTNFRRHLLWRPTPVRRAAAAHWLPLLQREDDAAHHQVNSLVQTHPLTWLNVLAGMPSTRWLAVLRPHAVGGQNLACGPTRREVADLGRVICHLHNELWLQQHYPGPLNHRGQDRLAHQANAIHRLLERLVAQREDAHLAFAVHVSGDCGWDFFHSHSWPAHEAERALVRAFQYLDVYPEHSQREDYAC